MAGTNLNAQFDNDTEISLTDENSLATTAECIGDPSVVAVESGVFANGCILRRTDLGTGAVLYENTGTSSSPSWSLITAGSSGIGGIIGPGQVAFGDFMVANSILGTDNLLWNGSTFTVGVNRFSVQDDGTTVMKVDNSYVNMVGLSNAFIQPTFNFNDNLQNIEAKVTDTSGINNRSSRLAVYASNAALYFDSNDNPDDTLHRFVTVDGEAVKIGSYENGSLGTGRSSNSSWGEASNSHFYGADGIVSRGMVADTTGAYFTTTDVSPIVPLLGINVADKKAVINYGERHKIRVIGVDLSTTTFDSDFIVVTQAVNNAVTVNLVSSPKNGDTFCIIDGSGTAAVHNTIVNGNGNNINGAGAINLQGHAYAGATFVWVESLSTWLIQSQF